MKKELEEKKEKKIQEKIDKIMNFSKSKGLVTILL